MTGNAIHRRNRKFGVMDPITTRTHYRYYVAVPVLAMALLWTEIYIFKQDDNVKMKLLKYQFVVILEVIMSCLSALVIKFSQNIPALSGMDEML